MGRKWFIVTNEAETVRHTYREDEQAVAEAKAVILNHEYPNAGPWKIIPVAEYSDS